MKIMDHEFKKYKGFPTRYDLNYWKVDQDRWLRVSSFELESEIEEIIKKLKEENIYSLSIDTAGNNYRFSLENLKYLTFIKELSIDSGSYVDVESLYLLNELESLWINNENEGEEIDLTRLKSLKKLIVSNTCKKLKGLFFLSNLETLKLQKFKENDLSSFTHMENLTALELVQAKITSLNGIEKMSKLKCLTLFYSPSLISIENIKSLKDLEYLALRVCKKIQKYDAFKYLNKLKQLSISDCSPIANLDFVRNLTNLEWFGLVDTNVIDGKIDLLVKVPEHGYTNKRNFNYVERNGIDIKKE